MSVSIDLLPLSDELHVYGAPQPESAYSLSGHVSVALHPAFSLIRSRKPASVRLRSLRLTFEGQTESISPNVAYAGLRVCHVTKQLVSGNGIDLTNDDEEQFDRTARWNIVFNLNIPGWLPESASFADSKTGVRYALHAKAEFMSIDNGHESFWMSAICSPFVSKQWSISSRKSITIKRFIDPPSIDPPPVSTSTFYIKCHAPASHSNRSTPISPNILNKLHISAILPSHIDTASNDFPVTLRLRTQGLTSDECQRLHFSEFSVDLNQKEESRHAPSAEYAAKFALPGETLQPPSLPLRDTHPVAHAYVSGFLVQPHEGGRDERTFSLLPGGMQGVYKLNSGSSIFKEPGVDKERQSWYSMDTRIPFEKRNDVLPLDETDWAGNPKLRPTSNGPLYSVHHDLRFVISLTYDLEEGGTAYDKIEFPLPIKFVRVAPPIPPSPWFDSEMASQSYDPQSLPVYSQLFYSNGDRKIDPTPLPLYTPRERHYLDLSQPIPYDKLFYDIDDSIDSTQEVIPLLS